MKHAQHRPSVDVPIEQKVAFLRQPDAYAEQPRNVTAIQTHMSWVFLTGRHAYKLRKPVRMDFLDFRTIESRRHDCNEELRLNRRLARSVYLDIVPLTLLGDGSMQLEGPGEPVDWLVKMRQLPTERLLDVMIRQRSVRPSDLRPAIDKLARFYRDAPAAEHDASAFAGRLEQQVRRIRSTLIGHDHRVPRRLIGRVADELLRRLDALRPAVAARIDEGRIVEGHGDLRPEHICLEHPPVIIDCIEFSRAFRIVDPADELSFLGMECARLNARWVVDVAFETYEAVTADHGARTLRGWFMAYRAFLRSRLAFGHLLDGHLPDDEQALWQARTGEYLTLAEQHLADR